jgi:replicative DNA helicase
VHPFNRSKVKPQRVLYVDCENGSVKLRRALRAMVSQAARLGDDPRDRMYLEAVPQGLDLTRPEDEAWLVRRVASIQPALLFIGPVYRLHADDPNKEEPARKVSAVLDRCRSAANCALVAEAHAGHGYGGAERPLRPTGTSLWLRWPEFGYGMQPAEGHTPQDRRVHFRSWRGDREERDWPTALRSGGPLPWSIDFGYQETA